MHPGAILGCAGHAVAETYSEFGLFQPNRDVATLERRYAVRGSSFVEVGDSRIHYAEHGAPETPTLLFLHGTYSSLHTWDGWVGELADEFHIVRLDLPGFGLTGPREDGELTLEYLIEAVGEFADAVGLADVSVVGNSLGGAIAWRLSLDRPDLVSRLVLIDAGGASLLTELVGNLAAAGGGFLSRFVTPRVGVRLLLRDAYGDRSRVTPDLVRRYHDLLLRPGNRRSVVELARNYAADHYPGARSAGYGPRVPVLPSAFDPTPEVHDGYDVGSVPVPTLVQWGGEDEWLPPSFGRRLASRIPDSRFLLYAGVGHVPMEEAPAETAADAAEFLR